jgi:hypothetical protein
VLGPSQYKHGDEQGTEVIGTTVSAHDVSGERDTRTEREATDMASISTP